MKVELVDTGDSPVLRNLAQLYQYDFSEFTKTDVDEDGEYHEVDFASLFAEPVHHAFLIRVDGHLAGFATVRRGEAFRDSASSLWWMDEFFVMRKYRKSGVGERVATMLFDRLGGTWEVAQVRSNVAAQAFWRKVIGRYTNGAYEEFAVNDDRWVGPVQYFHARAR